MGKNKKKFIDKKNASRYHLMHRSQRDVGGDVLEEGVDIGNTGMILWPDPNNNPDTDRAVLLAEGKKDTMKEWRSKLAQVGLLDEYDEQYLKPITGKGTFLSANGKAESAFDDPRTKNSVADELLAEVNQEFDGIPLAMDCMDEDIEQALMGDFDEGDFEEIADDFVFDAAKEPEEDDKEAFDFDAHIAKLMEEARKQAEDDPGIPMNQHDIGAKDHDFFARAKPLHAVGEDDDSLFGGGTTLDVTPGVVPSLNPDEERALCEQFEKALAEYDSDEQGDILEEEIYGDRPLEGDKQVEAALDDFLEERDGGFLMKGKAPEDTLAAKGGSGFSALVGTRMVPLKDLEGTEIPGTTPDEPIRPVSEIIMDAKKQIQSQPLAPPAEDVFIDGKSYYSMKERSQWDCESILTTYSNLDNNPTTIGAPSRRKKKHKQIQLSSKTGMPILENPAAEEDSDDDAYDGQTMISVNRGVARSKKETKEEKRARKAQVKKERQMARIVKKATKEVYKEEFEKRTAPGDDIAGNSVFRFS